jgi:NADPH-dependent curcumin reductase CurA
MAPTHGWSEFWVGPAEEFVKLDPNLLPSPVHHLSQGTTAYYGMTDIAQVGEGDVVFVSGAAGGVGSLAGQIAKCLGATKVIGSAGSKAKVDYLTDELGFDAAFDYHDGPLLDQLRRLAPEGITVFFDNVGGDQFTAAVLAAAPHARFALCGVLANQVGGTSSYLLPVDVMESGLRLLRLLPFACRHTSAQTEAWTKHFSEWLAEGRFVFPHTVVDGGIEATPRALLSLLNGEYRGNVTVKVSNGK